MDNGNDLDDNTLDSEPTSSFNLFNGLGQLSHNVDNDLGDHLQHPYTFGCQTKKPDSGTLGVQVNQPGPMTITNPTKNNNEQKNCLKCDGADDLYCHVKLNSLAKLKDSTKKLLILLEEIQSKTHSKFYVANDSYKISDLVKPIPNISSGASAVTEIIGASAIKKLETQAKTLDAIYVQDEEDDCSVYKRLTRKCNCLNRQEYNDFVIHFNEDTRYFTSKTGEIIKNLRILKKFIYMAGDYSKRAMTFLIEGLTDSGHTEKVEIIQGCAHADVCNVFDEFSIVIFCISWPCKYDHYGDATTQALAATLLFKLAQLEEGRRYLKFSSKITNDLKKVIRKRAAQLEFDTLEYLNTTLNLMHPPIAQSINVTYYSKPVDEGFGYKTMTALLQYRKYMTLDEVFTHLDLLHNLSNGDSGKTELTSLLPSLLHLFKMLFLEYDNSEMNIIITNILNNVISKNVMKPGPELPRTVVVADTSTEPILTKNETIQMPPKKTKKNKSKMGMGESSNAFRQASKLKAGKPVLSWRPPGVHISSKKLTPESNSFLNTSKKFSKQSRNDVIIVPIEEKYK